MRRRLLCTTLAQAVLLILTCAGHADTPDVLARGEAVFNAAGCASCHEAEDANRDGLPVLSGGKGFNTFAGTFYAPNISQDATHGIGSWTRDQIVTAVMSGISPEGRHYYPAFPYTAYAKAEPEDISALAAYLETLPPDPTPSRAHDLSFPFNLRFGVRIWKIVNMSADWAVESGGDPIIERGRYLAEALAHCGECHTPRTLTQGLDGEAWLAGAPNPSGDGRILDIRPGTLTWSEADIVAYFQTGFTPDFDTAGGSMVAVIRGLSKLPEDDLRAIAAYLKAVPPAVE